MALKHYLQGKPKEWKLDTTIPLQDIIFSIDDYTFAEKSAKSTGCLKCGRHTSEVFQVFCSKTSLHGIQYVGEKSNILIRLFWALIIVLALGSSIYHICQLYKKWEETPVMVTIAPKVKNIQEVYFPAVTICAPRILTNASRNMFLKNGPGNSNEKKKAVEEFCKKSDDSINGIWQSQQNDILGNYTQLSCERLLRVATIGPDPNIKPLDHVVRSRVLYDNNKVDCCTFNGLREDIMYKHLNSATNENKNKVGEKLLNPTGIGIRNAFRYKLEENIYCPKNLEILVSIHHPSEEPNVEGDGLVAKSGGKISYTVKPQDTQASDSIRSLQTKARGCQFSEDNNLRFYRNYTQYNCHMDCLANYTLDDCKCLAPYLPANNGTLELCNGVKFRKCFNNVLRALRRKEKSCNCDQPCAETMYLVSTQFVPSTKYNSTVTFDVYFTEPTFFSFQRSELYGLSDFLSSCGGLLGLFMGFSVISMIEVFYFSLFGIWRLFTGTCCRRRKS